MRFAWNEQQLLLQATLYRFVGERFSFENRRRRGNAGFDEAMWAELADMGILGLPFAEAEGGSGGSALDTLLVMEAFGRGLARTPYFSSIVLCGGLLRLAASQQQRSQLIPPLIAGKLRLSFAYAEQQSRFNLANVSTRAVRCRGGYALSGRKIVVFGAPYSQMFFVTAKTEVSSADGVSLFLIPSDASGLDIRCYQTVDGMNAAEIVMDNVQVTTDNVVGEVGQALPTVDRVVDETIVALCGEAIGAMSALNEKCVEFCKTRHAFGQPVANFQVIGHRLVDMQVAYEQAAAMALKAAAKIDAAASDVAKTVSACKFKVNQEAAFIGKHAIQLHGAMGMTDELDIGHYFKHLTTFQTMFGNSDHHLRRYIRLGDFADTAGSGSDGH